MVNIKEEWEKHKASKDKEEERKNEINNIIIKKEDKLTPNGVLDAVNILIERGQVHEARDLINKCPFNEKITSDEDAKTIAELWKVRDLINAGVLKKSEKKEIKKIPIELPGNGILISEFADKLAPVFKEKNILFYREDISSIVEIKNEEFREVKPIRFITLIEKYFTPWVKIWSKSGKSYEIDRSISQIVSNAVLASPNFEDKILPIKRIFPVQIPIIYNNQLTFPKKGYDERFNSWTLPNSPEIRTDISLDEAKNILYQIYKEFCFQSNQDYINAIAGLITPNLRGLFSDFNIRTPLKGYLANRERAGKDYCAGITGIVYEGRYVEETPISTGEYKSSGSNDELRKKIMSAFMQGRRGLHFANNKGKLNNAVLEGVLTNPIYSDRMLGTNKMGIFSNEMDYSFSGNIGITLTSDLINRTIFTRLFLDIEDANARNFKNPNLHEWVFENRGLILSSIYTLINNWVEKGKPKGSVPFSSYPEWANICGGIMESADLGNPCIKEGAVYEGISLDPEAEEMRILFETIYEKYPEEWITKQRILSIVEKSEENLLSYLNLEERSGQTKFGLKLNKNVERIYSDIRLIVKDKKIRTSRWEYKFTKEKSTFNKEEIFKGIKFGNVGNLGNVLPYSEYLYNKENIEHSKKVANVTKVTKSELRFQLANLNRDDFKTDEEFDFEHNKLMDLINEE